MFSTVVIVGVSLLCRIRVLESACFSAKVICWPDELMGLALAEFSGLEEEEEEEEEAVSG